MPDADFLSVQVIWGQYEPNKEFRYSEADQYLCKRILASSGKNWSQEVAKAHMVSGLYVTWRNVLYVLEKSLASHCLLLLSSS